MPKLGLPTLVDLSLCLRPLALSAHNARLVGLLHCSIQHPSAHHCQSRPPQRSLLETRILQACLLHCLARSPFQGPPYTPNTHLSSHNSPRPPSEGVLVPITFWLHLGAPSRTCCVSFSLCARLPFSTSLFPCVLAQGFPHHLPDHPRHFGSLPVLRLETVPSLSAQRIYPVGQWFSVVCAPRLPNPHAAG